MAVLLAAKLAVCLVAEMVEVWAGPMDWSEVGLRAVTTVGRWVYGWAAMMAGSSVEMRVVEWAD